MSPDPLRSDPVQEFPGAPSPKVASEDKETTSPPSPNPSLNRRTPDPLSTQGFPWSSPRLVPPEP